jgi:YbbR domain-containing protein
MPWLTSNPGLKIASLVLATVIWIVVKNVTSDWRIVDNVPLEIRARPGMTVLQTSASTVNVTVQGTREDVRQVSRQDLSAVIDLTRDPRTGEFAVQLGPRQVRHSRRVQIIQIEPAEVMVGIDALVERELPVSPQFTGELPPTLRIERVQVTPETESLKGPKTLLDSMSAVPTLPIDLTGRRTSFRERVELTPLQYPYGAAQRHWAEVDVRIGLAPSVDSNSEHSVEQRP